MKFEPMLRWDRALAVLVISWAIVLHGVFFVSAGALWRDEANSIHHARMPCWQSLRHALEYDSFPILYPMLLRIWSSHQATASDTGLRLFGALVGLANLLTLWMVARSLGSTEPILVLVFSAVNPVMITEGDSIRPYGLSVLSLVWTFGLLGKYATQVSGSRLVLAALSAALSVQLSYTNILYVAVFTLCAAWISFSRGSERWPWRVFLPLLVAALSLIPYFGVLRRAQGWVTILRGRTDWSYFVKQAADTYGAASITLLLAWLGIVVLAIYSLARKIRVTKLLSSPLPSLGVYSALVAIFALLFQVAFLEVVGTLPFHRYFLPCMALLGLACEAVIDKTMFRLRRLLVISTLIATSWPTLSWVRLPRTNVDQVAAVLGQQARPQDLVVISPWFLNTSFQRYYDGKAAWITIPDIEHYPLMRYDLVKQAMLAGDSRDKVARHIEEILRNGGVLWYVSQRWPSLQKPLPEQTAPGPTSIPDGYDYVRFRSFWERDIERRLENCCNRQIIPLPRTDPVWEEEWLVLSRWENRSH